MARKLNLRIWRGDATDGGLKDVQVDVNEDGRSRCPLELQGR
jgi:hypothetical protein